MIQSRDLNAETQKIEAHKVSHHARMGTLPRISLPDTSTGCATSPWDMPNQRRFSRPSTKPTGSADPQ
jgi:hypothetical protein